MKITEKMHGQCFWLLTVARGVVLNDHVKMLELFMFVTGEQLQNTGPLISISLNNKSCYCYLPRSTKDSNQFAYAGPEWPFIL